jgi:hypothetical protein
MLIRKNSVPDRLAQSDHVNPQNSAKNRYFNKKFIQSSQRRGETIGLARPEACSNGVK